VSASIDDYIDVHECDLAIVEATMFTGLRVRRTIGLVVAGTVAAMVFAGARSASAATLFFDDFSDGNADGWSTTNGAWSVAVEDGGQVLRQNDGSTDARAIASVVGRGTAAGTIVAARMKPRAALGGSGSVALLFNALDPNNYAYVALRGTRVELGQRQNGILTVLSSAAYTPNVGTWQSVTLDLTFPGRATATVAGTLPGAQVSAAIPSASGAANKVGFATANTVASFDDVRISDDVAPIDTSPPTPPGTPVASAITSSGFTLRWAASTDNVGVTGYLVSTVVPPGSAAPIQIWTTPTNSITITGLPSRAQFTLQVRAFDAAHNYSTWSAQITVVTLPPDDQIPPTAPGRPIASAVTSSGFTLTWSPSTDNVGVIAYFVRSVDGIVGYGSTTTTTFTVTGRAPGTAYTVAVVARDAAGNSSAPSEPVTVTTLPAGCVVTYRIANQWQSGFQAEGTARNTSTSAINGWTLQWAFNNGEAIASLWNATLVGVSGPMVKVRDAGWNASIAPGGTVSFGFTGTGAPGGPGTFLLNGQQCAIT
jgi:chitodextrinase